MPDNFKLGDAVWAKMRGFCAWPGRVAENKEEIKKPKKNSQMIYFFGTRNYAWVETDRVKDYIQYKKQLEKASKSAVFFKAVKAMDKYLKWREDNPEVFPEEYNDVPDDGPVDTEDKFDKLKESDKSPSTSSPSTPRAKKVKKQSGVGVKRTASTSSKTSFSAKRKRLTENENGASPSYPTSNNIKHYEEILNRPAILEVPDMPLVDLNNVSDNLKSKNIQASSATFGFIGLGIMGSGIVKNLINSGHKVNIYCKTVKKANDFKDQADISNPGQVEVYEFTCDVVDNSDIIFCCVSDPAVVKEIIYGNCGVFHQRTSLDGKGYVEMTSIDSETSIDNSSIITAKGGRYLEAQLQGSKEEADEGNLIVLGAGDKDLFDECNSCFTAIGKTVFYLGEVGFASKMNMVLQVMKGVALAGVAEALALADRSGLSPKDVLEIFKLTNMCSPFLKTKAEFIIGMDLHVVEQRLQHMQKDIRFALQLADNLRQPLLMAATANEIYKHARRLGYEQHDVSAVYMRTRY